MASATLMGPSPARPGGARRRHTRPEVPAPSRVTARRRRKTATGGVADLLTRWADTGYWRGTGHFLELLRQAAETATTARRSPSLVFADMGHASVGYEVPRKMGNWG